MINQFKKIIVPLTIGLAFISTSGFVNAQTSISNNNSGLCCDTVKGKCVVPMPNRPSPSRVSELGRYADLQKRLDKLDNGNCANAYVLNKAQAWLNMSRDVMHEGDGATVVNAAYEESEKLIKTLEDGKAPILETELIAGADKLRQDLWDMATARKASPALLSSAAREVAYCEVYLVRAGHAQAKLGGKARVEPLIGMAQDICQAAKDKAPCPVAVLTPAPVTAPTPAPAVVTATPAVVVQQPVVQPVYIQEPQPKRARKQDRN